MRDEIQNFLQLWAFNVVSVAGLQNDIYDVYIRIIRVNNVYITEKKLYSPSDNCTRRGVSKLQFLEKNTTHFN